MPPGGMGMPPGQRPPGMPTGGQNGNLGNLFGEDPLKNGQGPPKRQ